MARVQNTLIGHASGSIGGVTFTSWKGLNVAKGKPTSVANPRSVGQVAQRFRQKNALRLFRPLSTVVNIGYLLQAVGMSAYNAFMSENMKNSAVSSTDGNPILNPPYVQIAKGTLDLTTIFSATRDNSAHTIEVAWDGSVLGNKLATDVPYAAVIKIDGTVLFASALAAFRDDGSYSITGFPVGSLSTDVHLYLFFYQPSTRKASDSVYMLADV